MSDWQHPYVSVFKKFEHLIRKQGDCVQHLDSVISKRCYKLQGSVSANNYIEIPSSQGLEHPSSNRGSRGSSNMQGGGAVNGLHGTNRKSLGLTGEYVYLQIRTLGNKFFNVHLDFSVADKNMLERITLTNMRQQAQSQSRVILYPLQLGRDEWTTVRIHVPEILKMFNRQIPHAHVLKSVQICASCVVRGVYTSDLRYCCHGELPREMKFSQKAEDYAWQDLPAVPTTNGGVSLSNGVSTVATNGPTPGSRQPPTASGIIKNTGSSAVGVAAGNNNITGTSQGNKMAGTPNSLATATQNVLVTAGGTGMNENKITKGPTGITGNAVIAVDKSRVERSILEKMAANNNPAIAGGHVGGANIGDERPYETHSAAAVMHQYGAAFADVGAKPMAMPDLLGHGDNIGQEEEKLDNLIADPLVEVSHLLGVSASQEAFWLSEDRILFASSTALVILTIDPILNQPIGNPTCLFGHSRPIDMLHVSQAGDWVASVQQGGPGSGMQESPSVRLWYVPPPTNYPNATMVSSMENKNPRCLTILGCPSLLQIKCITFDSLSKFLAVGGLDTQRRQQIFVWDISRIGRGGNATLHARQLSDWDLSSIKFSPYEELRIVSCGKENIRFWRVKDGHLPGLSVALNAVGRNSYFTDLCFEANKNTSKVFLGEGVYAHKVFVSTMAGEVCVLSYKDRQVIMLHKLHHSPINRIVATESFCVTASGDKYIRVCPLDFQSFFLHCLHEGSVRSLDLTDDGLKVLTNTDDATIGILDISTQQYEVLHRSHAATINDCCLSILYEELVTVSSDGFIKLWNINTMRQHTEFFSGNDSPHCVCCHPKRHLIAVGFESGCLRIFDIEGPCVLHEFNHLRNPLMTVAFAETEVANKCVILACDSSGQVMLYSEASDFSVIRSPDLFSGVQEQPEEGVPYFKLANSHRLLLKYYDSKVITLFNFKTLEFLRKFKVQATIHSYDFSFDSTKVLIGSADSRLRIFTTKGVMIHDISLVAGPVTTAFLAGLDAAPGASLLFTASQSDGLLKGSLLMDNNPGVRDQEQCFVGHAYSPLKIEVGPRALFALAKGDLIKWRINGDYLEDLFYNHHIRQRPLPADNEDDHGLDLEGVESGMPARENASAGVENQIPQENTLLSASGNGLSNANYTNLGNLAESLTNSLTMANEKPSSYTMPASKLLEAVDYSFLLQNQSPNDTHHKKKDNSTGDKPTFKPSPRSTGRNAHSTSSSATGNHGAGTNGQTLPQSTVTFRSITDSKDNNPKRPNSPVRTPVRTPDLVNGSMRSPNLSLVIDENLLSAQKVRAPPNSVVKTSVLPKNIFDESAGRSLAFPKEDDDEILLRRSISNGTLNSNKSPSNGTSPIGSKVSSKFQQNLKNLKTESKSSAVEDGVPVLDDEITLKNPGLEHEYFDRLEIQEETPKYPSSSGLLVEHPTYFAPLSAPNARPIGTKKTESATITTSGPSREAELTTLMGCVSSFTWAPGHCAVAIGNWLSIEGGQQQNGPQAAATSSSNDGTGIRKTIDTGSKIQALDSFDDVLVVLGIDKYLRLYKVTNATVGSSSAESSIQFVDCVELKIKTAANSKLRFIYAGGLGGHQSGGSNNLYVCVVSAPENRDNIDSPTLPMEFGMANTDDCRIDVFQIHKSRTGGSISLVNNLQHLNRKKPLQDTQESLITHITSAQLTNPVIDLAAAMHLEFITVSRESLVFWRLAEPEDQFEQFESIPTLQFQQAQRPPWLSTTHHFTCVCYVASTARVLCGTNRGVLLIYDFDENLLLSEISIVGSARGADGEISTDGLSMISSPCYPVILCGMGSQIKKFTINEASATILEGVCSAVGISDKADSAASIQLDGPIRECQVSSTSIGSASIGGMRVPQVGGFQILGAELSPGCIVSTRTSMWFVNWKKNQKVRLHTFHSRMSYHIQVGPTRPSPASKEEDRMIASCGEDGIVRLWNLQQKSSNNSAVSAAPPNQANQFNANNSFSTLTSVAQFSGGAQCHCLCFLSQNILFCGFSDGCARLFDVQTMSSVGRIEIDKCSLKLAGSLSHSTLACSDTADRMDRADRPQTAITASIEGKILQVVVRFASNTKELIDARRAELKSAGGVPTCIDIGKTKFLVGFETEVWLWDSSKIKPQHMLIWVLPNTDSGGTSNTVSTGNAKIESCFANKECSRMVACVKKTLYVYGISEKSVLNRIEIGSNLLRIRPTTCISTVNNVWADATSLVGLCGNGDVCEIILWDKGKAGRMETLIENAAIGGIEESTTDPKSAKENADTNDLLITYPQLIIKTKYGMGVWKLD